MLMLKLKEELAIQRVLREEETLVVEVKGRRKTNEVPRWVVELD